MSKRKPLTLEELRKMGGKLVWCEPLKDWGKIFKFGIAFFGSSDFTDWEEIELNYGKTWTAYATEPPRLDRSAWEPCEYCGECRKILTFDVAGDAIAIEKEKGLAVIESDSFGFFINYCPNCGRPLADVAWDMLEKRLEFH